MVDVSMALLPLLAAANVAVWLMEFPPGLMQVWGFEHSTGGVNWIRMKCQSEVPYRTALFP